MFDFLKKKIGGFVDKLTKKESEKPPKKPEEEPEEKPPEKIEPPKAKPAPKPAEKKPPAKKEAKPTPKPVEKKPAPPPKPEPVKVEKPPAPKIEPKAKPAEVPKPKPPKPEKKIEPPKVEKPKVEEKPVPEKPEIKVEEKPEIRVEEEKVAEEKPEIAEERIEAPPKIEEKVVEKPPEKPKERMKLGAFGAIKSLITREVEISEGDVGDLLEEFELELLEADVDISVAEAIKDELKEKLVGSKIKKDALHAHINQTMKETLVDMLSNENAFDIVEKVNALEKPVSIMFLGINGSGKTTTIAKVAKLLMDSNHKVVFAAADTFRAAAIEQMGVHADRLGVRMIKRDYGSDPTSVAYDAANYAKAHGIDAVLIDTAGRQETNISLINEMKKMTRVIKPDLKIYIGESIAGQAILEQISAFNREIGIDAVILTKLDCDPKGGTMLSINRVTGIPIIYVGIGQAYDDLEKFDAEGIAGRIVD